MIERYSLKQHILFIEIFQIYNKASIQLSILQYIKTNPNKIQYDRHRLNQAWSGWSSKSLLDPVGSIYILFHSTLGARNTEPFFSFQSDPVQVGSCSWKLTVPVRWLRSSSKVDSVIRYSSNWIQSDSDPAQFGSRQIKLTVQVGSSSSWIQSSDTVQPRSSQVHFKLAQSDPVQTQIQFDPVGSGYIQCGSTLCLPHSHPEGDLFLGLPAATTVHVVQVYNLAGEAGLWSLKPNVWHLITDKWNFKMPWSKGRKRAPQSWMIHNYHYFSTEGEKREKEHGTYLSEGMWLGESSGKLGPGTGSIKGNSIWASPVGLKTHWWTF